MKTLFKSYKAKLPASNQAKKFETEGKSCIIEQEGEFFNLYLIEENTMTTQTENTTDAISSQKVEVIQNGIKRPDAKSKAGAIWALADEMSKESPVSFNTLIKEAVARDMNPSTVFGEYSKWRKFYGITGTVIDPEVAAEREAKKKAAEEAKAKREANKVSRIVINGISRPSSDSKTGQLWALADELSAAKGSPVDTKNFIEEGLKRKLTESRSTLTAQLYNWRKFYGLIQSRELTLEQLETKLANAKAEVERLEKAIVEKQTVDTQQEAA